MLAAYSQMVPLPIIIRLRSHMYLQHEMISQSESLPSRDGRDHTHIVLSIVSRRILSTKVEALTWVYARIGEQDWEVSEAD